MANLGAFGAAIRELEPDAERDTFEFFGVEFAVHGTIPPIVELHISAYLAGKVGGVEGDAALFEALKHALTIPATEPDGKPDRTEWHRFYELAVERRAGSGSLVSLALTILGAQVGRPTVRPSTSLDGPPPTSTNSNSSLSDSPVSQDQPVSRDQPVFRRVDEVLGGSETSPGV